MAHHGRTPLLHGEFLDNAELAPTEDGSQRPPQSADMGHGIGEQGDTRTQLRWIVRLAVLLVGQRGQKTGFKRRSLQGDSLRCTGGATGEHLDNHGGICGNDIVARDLLKARQQFTRAQDRVQLDHCRSGLEDTVEHTRTLQVRGICDNHRQLQGLDITTQAIIRVQRIDGNNTAVGCHCGEYRRHIVGTIAHHHAHSGALGKSQLLQIAADRIHGALEAAPTVPLTFIVNGLRPVIQGQHSSQHSGQNRH